MKTKTKTGFLISALSGTCALAFVSTSHAATPPAPSGANVRPAAMAAADSNQVLTRAEALKLVEAAKKYEAHPAPAPDGELTKPKIVMPDFDIATAPPAPRAETKPDAPSAGMVWVAGHYMPVNGEWRWVRGEWAVPALPISVWIPAKYDEEKKHWYPGYWQPDAPSTPAPEPSAKEEKAATKSPVRY